MIKDFLPYSVFKRLFGDRKFYGPQAWEGDKEWEKWLAVYPEVYRATQRAGGIQRAVNDAGYSVLHKISLDNKNVAEIGPGGGYHFTLFRGIPNRYIAIDVCEEFFPNLYDQASHRGIPIEFAKVVAGHSSLPFPSESQDIILSFYSLEHLYPLQGWVTEIFRVLKPTGLLVGAIPNEGGVLWGLGRLLTSATTLRRKFGLDITKIVCWEHPNLCDDIMKLLKKTSRTLVSAKWPLDILPPDFSLVTTFIAEK